MGKDAILAIALVMTFLFLLFLLLFFSVVRLWIQALLLGVPVGIVEIIGMKLRRAPPKLIVHTAILLKQHKVAASVREIEQCYFAHGLHACTATELATLVVEVQRKSEK
jgi:uncharacterized protein YqfA (UPF0365 family)